MDRLILLLLGLIVAWGAFAFGGVYLWAYRPLLYAAALAGLVAWLRADRRGAPVVLMAALLATGAAVAVQLVPLGHTTLQRHFPGTHLVLSDTNFAYATAVAAGIPYAHPISVSPGRTMIGLLFLGCSATLALGVSQWLTRERLRHLAVAVAVTGAALAVTGLIQQAISPRMAYGVWQSEQGGMPFGPFINRNHFAGWMLMGLPVALGLAVGLAVRGAGRSARDWRDHLLRFDRPAEAGAVLAALAALAMTLALLMTLSRSAMTSAAAALALALLTTAGPARGWAHRSGVALAAAGAALVAWVGVDLVAARFADLDLVTIEARTGMWRDTWRMMQDAPLAGIGIRAYTVASLVYQTTLPQYHVGAAHSDWLQLAAEGGLLVGLPGLWLVATIVATATRRFSEHRRAADHGTTYWIRVGACTGLTAIAMQSLVEFSLQMPGNLMLCAILVAIAIAPLPARS